MRTIVGVALVYFLTVSHFANSQPDKDWWACQYVEDSGLYWKDNNWVLGRYKMEQKPFVLVSDGQGSLTTDSVSKPMDTVHDLSCAKGEWGAHVHCHSNLTGTSLSFDGFNQRGVVTTVFGALMDGDARDSLHLKPFECAEG